MEWLKQQGPWCPALIEYLRRNHQQYDVLIFFTYLYAPTVLGLEIAPQRSILVSTAHDEPAIRLEIFKDVFRKPAALCYLTESERRFVEVQFPDRPLLEETVGVGVDLPQQQAYPRMPAPPPDDEQAPSTAGGDATEPDTDVEDGAATLDFPAHLRGARRRVPAPAPAARPDRALRRPHRSGQGLRGADRVLQRLREGRRRRDARADGRRS